MGRRYIGIRSTREKIPGHNCVTWATMVVNRELDEEVFPLVREGRIKLAFTQLVALGGKTGDEDN